VPPEDFESGRARRGYSCNVDLVSYTGLSGGFRVERYVDAQRHVCAFYDSTRLLPADIPAQVLTSGLGVYAVDMTDPARPVVTDTLKTPAMVTPHESLRLNQKRGLLVANAGNPATYPGVVDVYDVKADCRHPKLLSSTPFGILGHESGFSPDGLTYYVASTFAMTAAIDLTNPSLPTLLWASTDWSAHGVSVSTDGNTLYIADMADKGLTVLDVSEIQQRKPQPQVREISHLSWPEVSIPQNATPFTSRGHKYLVETDEYGGGDADTPVGGARIIDVDDPRRPKVVSRLRLEVHNKPETSFSAHYCTVPSRIDPYVIACGMINSGLRVFDVRDVRNPKEVAYANYLQYGTWLNQTNGSGDEEATGSVFAAPTYDPTRNDIWFTDGLRGLFVVHLTPASGITRLARTYALPGS
jgi:hypothetical protein